jgi:hypothetical protein
MSDISEVAATISEIADFSSAFLGLTHCHYSVTWTSGDANLIEMAIQDVHFTVTGCCNKDQRFWMRNKCAVNFGAKISRLY